MASWRTCDAACSSKQRSQHAPRTAAAGLGADCVRGCPFIHGSGGVVTFHLLAVCRGLAGRPALAAGAGGARAVRQAGCAQPQCGAEGPASLVYEEYICIGLPSRLQQRAEQGRAFAQGCSCEEAPRRLWGKRSAPGHQRGAMRCARPDTPRRAGCQGPESAQSRALLKCVYSVTGGPRLQKRRAVGTGCGAAGTSHSCPPP